MAAEDLYLSDDELDQLTDAELAQYLRLLEASERVWSLTDKQQQAEALAGEVDILLYGGAAGGAKSNLLLWHAYQLSQRFPGHSSLVLRESLPQLKRSLILRSLERYDPKLCEYKVADKTWVFKNGSRITFGHCDTEEDFRNYLSDEYDLIEIDESSEFTEYQVLMLRSRCRTTMLKRARGVRPHMLLASNPGGVGHQFHFDTFVDATDWGRHTATREFRVGDQRFTMTVGFVQAKVQDNPHIDPGYVATLAALPEVERKQYLDGDWLIFAGQFFAHDFDRDYHVVDPFPIPAHWPRIRAIDPGYAAPFCCLWIAFDADGNAYVYREAYQAQLVATEQAKLVLALSGREGDDGRLVAEDIDYTVAGIDLWAQKGTGVTQERQYRDAGLICRKAMMGPGARIAGWSQVRRYMHGRGDPDTGPRLTIFRDACPNLIRTLPKMIYSKTLVEDMDTTLEDHAVDALRYGLMSRPRRARLAEAKSPELAARDRDLEQLLRRSRRNHPVLGSL